MLEQTRSLKRSLLKLKRRKNRFTCDSCPCSRPSSPVPNCNALSKSEGFRMQSSSSETVSAESFTSDDVVTSSHEFPDSVRSSIVKPLFMLPQSYCSQIESFDASHHMPDAEKHTMRYTSGYSKFNMVTAPSMIVTSAINIIRFLTHTSAATDKRFQLVIMNDGITNNFYKMIYDMFPSVESIDVWSKTHSTGATYPGNIRKLHGTPSRSHYPKGCVVFVNDCSLRYSSESMQEQASIFDALQPDYAMLNLQLRYPSKSEASTFRYYEGSIIAIPYSHGLSSDAKLYTTSNPSIVDYDLTRYDEMMFYHNIVKRNTSRFTLGDATLYDEILLQPLSPIETDQMPLVKSKTLSERSEIYHSFDFCLTVHIIMQYLEMRNLNGDVISALKLWMDLERKVVSCVYRPFFAKI